MKRILSVLLTLALVLALVPAAMADGSLSGIKIGILGYQQSGEPVTAINNFMNAMHDATGIEFIYVCGSSYDEQTNLTQVQNMLSSGCNGIIMCMDTAMEAVIEECEMAEVFVGGFLCDFERSMDMLKTHSNFVGTVCDGPYDNTVYGTEMAAKVIADGRRSVGLLTSPYRYYPHKQEAVEAFVKAIDDYNATAEEKIAVSEVEELAFRALDATYFANHPDIDCIVSFSAGTFVYPTMISEGRTDLCMYAVGFESEEAFLDNMRKGVCGLQTYSNEEAVIYPLVLLINAIQGNRYADQPAEAERVDSSVVFVSTPEEIDAVMTKSFYLNPVFENSFLTTDQIKDLILSYNPNATYADLVAPLTRMGIEDIIAK